MTNKWPRVVAFVVAGLFVLMGIGVALAQDPATPAVAGDVAAPVAAAAPAKVDSDAVAYTKVVFDNLIPLIFLIVTPLLVLLVRRFIKYLEDRFNWDMSAQSEAQLDAVLRQALLFAEEKARTAVKTDPATLPGGAQKLNTALKFATDELHRLGLDQLAADKLAALLEAKLFDLRERESYGTGTIPASLKESAPVTVPVDEAKLAEWREKTLAALGLTKPKE